MIQTASNSTAPTESIVYNTTTNKSQGYEGGAEQLNPITYNEYPITGHARGLGRSPYEHFKSLGHNVEGYSPSTGYDINILEGRKQILDGLDQVDVFVNNAWSEYFRDKQS